MRIKNNRDLTQGVWLALLQFVNYAFPLLVTPILLLRLGISGYGDVVFFQTVGTHIGLIVEYGFSWEGIQRITSAEDEYHRCNILIEIMATRFLILIVIAVIYFAMMLLGLIGSPVAGAVCLLAGLAAVFNHGWYFQGKSDSFVWLVLNGVARIVAFVLIVVFVHGIQSSNLALSFVLLPSLLSGVIATWHILTRRVRLSGLLITPTIIKRNLIQCWPLFVANYMAQWISGAGIIVLGSFCSSEVVGHYGVIERTIKAVQLLFVPVSQLYYAKFCRLFAQKYAEAVEIWFGFARIIVLAGAGLLLILVVSGIIVYKRFDVLNGDYFIVYLLLSFWSVLGIYNNVIGIQFMLPNRMNREYSFSMILSGFIAVVSLYCGVRLFGVSGISGAILLSESVLLMLLVMHAKRRLQTACREFGEAIQ